MKIKIEMSSGKVSTGRGRRKGGQLGPDLALLCELEPQLAEQGGVGHTLPPQAGQ